MECPHCKEQMTLGKIRTNFGRARAGDLYWLPDDGDLVMITPERVEKHGGMLLCQGIYPTIPAWRCNSCKILLVSWE